MLGKVNSQTPFPCCYWESYFYIYFIVSWLSERLLECISLTSGGAWDLSETIYQNYFHNLNFDFCLWDSGDNFTNHAEGTGEKPAVTWVWLMSMLLSLILHHQTLKKKGTVSSRHLRAAACMNSQCLWQPTWDLCQPKPEQIPTGGGEVGLKSYSEARSYWQRRGSRRGIEVFTKSTAPRKLSLLTSHSSENTRAAKIATDGCKRKKGA